MKKKLTIITIIILITIIVTEGYIFYKNNLNTNNVEINNKEQKKDMSQYLVDIYTPYNQDSLTYILKNEERAKYFIIDDGLKDENVKNLVNNKIENKIKKLIEEYPNETITGRILSNFENTISITFETIQSYEFIYEFQNYINNEDYKPIDLIDTLNIDLNTGKELTLEDIVNNKNVIQTPLINQANEDFIRLIGFMDDSLIRWENPKPDYSTIEDDLFKIINKFNNNDISFAFSPKNLYLLFNDVYITAPLFLTDEVLDGLNENECLSKNYSYIDGMCIDYKHYKKNYTSKISLDKLVSSLIIYNRFKSDESIYKSLPLTVERKFMLPEEGVDDKLIESDNSLVDYYLISYDTNQKILNDVYKKVTEESKHLLNNNFNIINYTGQKSTTFDINNYSYISFKVLSYDLTKEEYEKYKQQIYLDKNYRYYYEEENIIFNYGYEYLNQKLNKENYYYYIYDKNGNYIKTSDIFSKTFDFNTIIPDEWIKNSKYNNVDEMLQDALIIIDNPEFESDNHLILKINLTKASIKYKEKEIILANSYMDTQQLLEQIFRME